MGSSAFDLGVKHTQVRLTETVFADGQHLGFAQCIIGAVCVTVAAFVQEFAARSAGCTVLHLCADRFGGLQLRHIQHGVRVSREHAGAGRTVHTAFPALCSLAVVVAIDHRTPKLTAHQIELIAEFRHLIGRIFVAGDNFVDRVQHHGDVSAFCGPADQLRRQLVHGYAGPAQVPHVDIAQILRVQPHCGVYVTKTVKAARTVQLQIDIQHFSLCTAEPSEPWHTLRNADAKFNERKTLAGLGGPRQQHLVSLAEHALDQSRGQLRHVFPRRGHALCIRQIIRNRFHPIFPLAPVRLAEIGFQQILFLLPAHGSRHA